jgi:tetratricopeptide (TPR) repeat protein
VLDLAGQNDAADAAYREALAGGLSPAPVDAYGRFLERAGRTADARALYAKLTAEVAWRRSSPPAWRGSMPARSPSAWFPPPPTAQQKRCSASRQSLTDQTSADIAILYLRLSLYLSPHLDLAKIVLADRFEALDKFDDAIAIYRAWIRIRPTRSAASFRLPSTRRVSTATMRRLPI